MSKDQGKSKTKPFITPHQLLKGKAFPEPIEIAFVCYTPFPTAFTPYVEKTATERYLLHSPPSEIRFCRLGTEPFLVVSEVYGGPVSTTTVEELAFYGVKKIIGLGYAGGIYTGKPGEHFLAIASQGDDGATGHYTNNKILLSDQGFYHTLNNKAKEEEFPLIPRNVWTTDALYQEYQPEMDKAREEFCTVVNMDTRHLFAAAEKVGIRACYLGTISDVLRKNSEDDDTWEDELSETVSGGGGGITQKHNELVDWLVDYLKN